MANEDYKDANGEEVALGELHYLDVKRQMIEEQIMNDNASLLDNYQQFTPTTAIYPHANTGDTQELLYLACGLTGEAGEVAEKIKKRFRDNKFDADELAKELGDVMYYLSQISNAIHKPLKNIIVQNRDKLIDRQNRKVLGGSGDNR